MTPKDADPVFPSSQRREETTCSGGNMELAMQAILANAFAAAMTFAVINFSSPVELWSWVKSSIPQPQTIETAPSLPPNMPLVSGTQLGAVAPQSVSQSEIQTGKQMALCAAYLSHPNRATNTESCRTMLEREIEKRPGYAKSIALERPDPVIEQIRLAQTYYCRYQWAKGVVPSGERSVCS